MNTPQERAAFMQAQATCAMIEALGMTAENMQRALNGDSMAYQNDAFNVLIDKYNIHHNAMVSFLRD